MEATDGQCILYEGRPVLAVFHSSSAGATQDAADVWSASLPYLRSVETPEDEEAVPGYRSTVSFQAAQLKELLRAACRRRSWGQPLQLVHQHPPAAQRHRHRPDRGGRGGGGNQLRTILDLRSACFTMAFDGDQVTFSVTGYGHGVGMSQYGANVLAQGGWPTTRSCAGTTPGRRWGSMRGREAAASAGNGP